MKLDDHERNSALWQKIKKHLEERIASSRKKNDADLDEKQTAKLRGRIAEAQYVLSMGEDAQKIPVGDSSSFD